MQQSLESRLAEYVSIPSVTQNTKECRRLITKLAIECTRLGMYTYLKDGIHPSFVATTLPTKHPKIMMVIHADVVPSSDDSMFTMTTEKDSLLGRGVYDMKYALATTMEFLYRHSDRLKEYDIGLMVTTDEELGGHEGVAKLLEDGWKTDLAIVPDGGEPWSIESRAKGMKTYRLIAGGRSSHGSRPWEGDNAIVKLNVALSNITKHFPSTIKGGITASINKINGGSASNQVPDHAEAFVDFRAFEADDFNTIEKKITLIAKHAGIKAVQVAGHNSLKLDIKSTYIKQFAKVYKTIHGKSLTKSESYGATDASWFAEIGIPSLVIRPEGGGMHGSKEWIKRQDLTLFYKTMEAFLVESSKNVTISTTPSVDKFVDSLVNR